MKQKILDSLKTTNKSINQLENELEIRETKQIVQLNKSLNQLIEEELIFEKNDLFYLTSNYLRGSYKKGYINDQYPLLSNKENLMDNDEVYFTINKRQEAQLIKINKRNTKYVFGKIISRRNKLIFYSDKHQFKDYKVVNLKETKGLYPGLEVRCYICDYFKRLLKIDTLIGQCNVEDTLIKTILLENDAPKGFNKKVLEECNQLDKVVIKEDRIDLTDKNFITIDGQDAKDFDDAIYVEKNELGYKLYVAIADVSYYVRPDTAIDKEASLRATSIYYPKNVIPMLPEILCNDLCSLKPNTDRYAIVCQMDIDYEGEVKDYQLFPAIINSKQRATYNKINKLLEHDTETLKEYDHIKQMVYTAYELSRIVDHKRKEKGGIEFDSSDVEIIEENNEVVDIKKRQSSKAETLIEDFMIMANQTVASHFYYLNWPLIYRNHDYPKADKLQSFMETVENLNYNFKGNKNQIKSSALQACLTYFENSEEYPLVSNLLLRSMAKALYSTNNIGHYGLGLEQYCHFTSPIRRYPDLIVHRLIRQYCFNNDYNQKDNLEKLVKLANDGEKRATQIERNILDLKRCEYMQNKIGQVFKGRISSVVNFGIYVELPNTVEGLIHISNLNHELENYHIGQEIKVRLIEVNLSLRTIDFMPIEKHLK